MEDELKKVEPLFTIMTEKEFVDGAMALSTLEELAMVSDFKPKIKRKYTKKSKEMDTTSSTSGLFEGLSGRTLEPTVGATVLEKKPLLTSDRDVIVTENPIPTEIKDAALAPKTYQAIDGFLIEKGISKVLAHNIKNRVSTMLLGPTGVGKTEMVAAIAKSLNMDYTIFDMGTMTDPIMSLIGTHAITVKDGQTQSEFKASRFSEVIQKPGIVVLDELSRAAAGSNNLLFPCLDFRRELPMEYSFENFEPIKIHPDCVFIATANTGSQYTGTHKLDKALIDRFMILEIETLNSDGCKYVLKEIFKGSLTNKDYETIVNIFFAINKEHDEFKINFSLSMRHLKTIASMVKSGFTIYDSYYAVCKGIGGKAAIDSITSIINPTVK